MIRIVLITLALAVASAATLAAHGGEEKACPMRDAVVASTENFSGEGRLLCMHCNLHRENSCRKVFQPAHDESQLIEICSSTTVDLEAVSREGEALLNIEGRMVTSKDGRKMLVIESVEEATE